MLALHLYPRPAFWREVGGSIAPGDEKRVPLHMNLFCNLPTDFRYASKLDFWDHKLSAPVVIDKQLHLTIDNPSNEYLDKSSDLIIKIIFLKSPEKICLQSKYYTPSNFRKMCFC